MFQGCGFRKELVPVVSPNITPTPSSSINTHHHSPLLHPFLYIDGNAMSTVSGRALTDQESALTTDFVHTPRNFITAFEMTLSMPCLDTRQLVRLRNIYLRIQRWFVYSRGSKRACVEVSLLSLHTAFSTSNFSCSGILSLQIKSFLPQISSPTYDSYVKVSRQLWPFKQRRQSPLSHWSCRKFHCFTAADCNRTHRSSSTKSFT